MVHSQTCRGQQMAYKKCGEGNKDLQENKQKATTVYKRISRGEQSVYTKT